MNKLTISSSVLVLLFANSAHAQTPSQILAVPDGFHGASALGAGFNAWDSTFTEDICLDRIQASPPVRRPSLNVHVHEISTASNLARALRVSLHAGFGIGIYSADASMSLFNQFQQRQNRVHFVVEADVISEEQSVLPGQNLVSPSIPLDQFFRRCGTHYVASRTMGGSFFLLLSADRTEQTSLTALAQSLRAGIESTGSVDASRESAERAASSVSSLSIQILRRGGTSPLPNPTNRAAVFDYIYGRLQSDITTTPTVRSIRIARYPRAEAGRYLSPTILDRYYSLLAYHNALSEIAQNPSQFRFPVPGSERNTEQLVTLYRELYSSIGEYLAAMRDFVDSCNDPGCRTRTPPQFAPPRSLCRSENGPCSFTALPLPDRLDTPFPGTTPRITGGCYRWSEGYTYCHDYRYYVHSPLQIAQGEAGFRLPVPLDQLDDRMTYRASSEPGLASCHAPQNPTCTGCITLIAGRSSGSALPNGFFNPGTASHSWQHNRISSGHAVSTLVGELVGSTRPASSTGAASQSTGLPPGSAVLGLATHAVLVSHSASLLVSPASASQPIAFRLEAIRRTSP